MPLQNNLIPLFDLHCDTLLELYKSKTNIRNNNLHISFEKASAFSPYIQICAIWSDSSLSNDEAYKNYCHAVRYAKSQINFSTSLKKLNSRNFILAVEDARILNNDLDRLTNLFNDGVRVLTLTWHGQSVIGGGWDTTFGLTDFGKETVKKCFKYGIIPDISHSSTNTIDEVIILAENYKLPVIASHSNAYDICQHKRNISCEHFKWLVKNHSILGVSLASEHLSSNSQAKIRDILNHINYFLDLDGENNISLGCDFDGITSLPVGVKSIYDLTFLYTEIEKVFGSNVAKKIFYENAYNFMSKNLK